MAAQHKCQGCKDVEILWRRKINIEKKDPNHEEELRHQIHRSYKELEDCAKGCRGCQVFRRAFLLNQITTREAESLQDGNLQGEVWVKLPARQARQGHIKLEVSIKSPNLHRNTATVSCMHENIVASSTLTRDSSIPMIFNQIKHWLADCDKYHNECGNLRWSSKNPTYLIQILRNSDTVKLIESREIGLLDYTALSYSWGDKKAMGPDEWERIRGNKTGKGNLQGRRQPFLRSQLSETIRDAISLTESLGIEYIWVDAVCIPPDVDWNEEANRMHEVYGNAYLTLCACSTERATDRLFRAREAWLYHAIPCNLSDQWLVNFDMSLNEVRVHAPVFSRGWTLQEERLSRRILYWCGQRMYWSCSKSQELELSTRKNEPRLLPEDGNFTKCLDPPQTFLKICRIGDKNRLHQEWLDLVQAYTLRNIYDTKNDRFPALSGLAVKYLQSKRSYTNHEGTVKREEYLAGLWRGSLTGDLAWSVVEAKDSKDNLRQVAPTWSWASLPTCTRTSMQHDFKDAAKFHLLEVLLPECHPDKETDVLDIIRRGAEVKSVKVCGRLRRFVSHDSQKKPWSAIQWRNGTEGQYDFRNWIDQQVHSRNLRNGKVLAYEAHKQEVVGQLDYLTTSNEGLGRQHCVLDAAEEDLYCLEIGESAMLLLEKDHEDSTFRRSGVSRGYRPNFFDEAQVEELVLA